MFNNELLLSKRQTFVKVYKITFVACFLLYHLNPLRCKRFKPPREIRKRGCENIVVGQNFRQSTVLSEQGGGRHV